MTPQFAGQDARIFAPTLKSGANLTDTQNIAIGETNTQRATGLRWR